MDANPATASSSSDVHADIDFYTSLHEEEKIKILAIFNGLCHTHVEFQMIFCCEFSNQGRVENW